MIVINKYVLDFINFIVFKQDDLLYFLNKIDFDSYLKRRGDENFNYIRRILIHEFEDNTSVRIKHLLIVPDGFGDFFR